MANQLLEAAAEILANSKKSAPSDSPKKPEGEIQDLGGDTPEKHADSNVKNATGTKAVAPTTKPSAASSQMEETEELDEVSLKTATSAYVKRMGREHGDVEYPSKASQTMDRIHNKHGAKGVMRAATAADKEHGIHDAGYTKKDYVGDYLAGRKQGDPVAKVRKEEVEFDDDIDAIFGDENISEEFKSKVSTIFEARVTDRINTIAEEIEAEYSSMLEEAVESIRTDLTEKVNDYLDYIVEEWMKQNEVAIEKGLRTEMVEDFINGLRNLFAEHYIDVPAEKVDLVDELATKVESLEDKLNEEIQRGIEYKKQLTEAKKIDVVRTVCEGLTSTQVEKIKSLAESVEFSTEEEYQEKLETIRENYFPSGMKKANASQMHEQVEDGSEKPAIKDARMAAYASAISKHLPK
jgi:hypothetical protein